jgi:hypothetical protein
MSNSRGSKLLIRVLTITNKIDSKGMDLINPEINFVRKISKHDFSKIFPNTKNRETLLLVPIVPVKLFKVPLISIWTLIKVTKCRFQVNRPSYSSK